MERVNVLFTSAGRRVELLRAFRAAYASEGLEGTIVATDVDRLAPALRVADRAEIVPRTDDPGFLPWILGLCKAHRVDVVFPLTDPDIPALAAGKAEFLRAHVAVAIMSSQSIGIAADKWATVQLLRRLNVPAPRSRLGESLLPDLLGDGVSAPFLDRLFGDEPADGAPASFPLYLKPRFGSAAAHTARVDDPVELRTFLQRVPQPVVQEFLPGPEITCDLAYSVDGEFLGMCQRRRISVRGGEVQKGVTVWDESVASHCLRIGRALDARGPITIQCLFKDGLPYFTEINARFGGGIPLAIAAGLDFPRWYLALAAGRRPTLAPLGVYTHGLYLTRFDESFFLDERMAGQGPAKEERPAMVMTPRL